MLSGHNMTFKNKVNFLFAIGYGFLKNASYAQSKYIAFLSIIIFIFLYFLEENIIYNAVGCKQAGRFSAQTLKG